MKCDCAMDTGFRFVPGCRAECETRLTEGFAATENGFIANVSAENIGPLLHDYIAAQTEELFLFLEVPSNAKDETEPGKLHTDVYYWDGLTRGEANALLDEYGDWLIGCGMTEFGFGVKGFSSEIMKRRYNVVSVYTRQPERERALLEKRLPARSELLTAWDYLTPDHPGDCVRFERDGRTIYDIIPELTERGLYFAERREMDGSGAVKQTERAEPRWSRKLRIVLHGGLLLLIGAALLAGVWQAYAGLDAAADATLSALNWLLLIIPAAAVAATAIRPWRGKLAALLIPYAYAVCVGAAFLLTLL